MTKKLIAGATLLVLAAIAQIGLTAAQMPTNDTGATTIHGSVTDPSGAVIPGAMVIISTPQWNRTVSTDDEGQYELTGLAPGHYRVRVRFGGFATFDKSNFVVTQGHGTEVNAQLELREMRQAISVFE